MSRTQRVEEPEHETVAIDAPRPRRQRWRTCLLVLFFVGTLAAAKATGLDEHISVEVVRDWMQSMGVWVFVSAASIAYGQAWGVPAAYFGSLVSVGISFLVVRGIGGQPLGDVRKPWMKKILARLTDRPVTTVALLRLVLFLTPALNYALAMSSIRFRDYMIGSALGLLLPIPVMVLFIDWIATW